MTGVPLHSMSKLRGLRSQIGGAVSFMSGLEGGVTLYSIKGWSKVVAFLLCPDQREGLTTFYVWARGDVIPTKRGLEGGVPYLLCMGLKKVFSD